MKIIALLVGPAGIALLGQLNNFVSIILSFAGGGINNGITKYTSQYRDNPDRLSRYLSVGLRLTVISGSTIGILLILLAIPLSSVILLNPDYAVVFRIFGFTLLLYAANNFILSVINGFKEFRRKRVCMFIHAALRTISSVTTRTTLWYVTAATRAPVVRYSSTRLTVNISPIILPAMFTVTNCLNSLNPFITDSMKLFAA